MAALLDLGDDAVVSPPRRSRPPRLRWVPERCRSSSTLPASRDGASQRRRWNVHTTASAGAHRPGPRSTGFRRRQRVADDHRPAPRPATIRELERAIDSAVRDGSSSPTFLARRLTSFAAAAGGACVSLDRLLVDSGGHSDLERRFLALVRRPGCPRPTCQRVVPPRRRDARPRRLQLRAASGDRRGHRPTRPRFGCRAGQGRSAAQRAPAPRLRGARVHQPAGPRRSPTIVIRTLPTATSADRSGQPIRLEAESADQNAGPAERPSAAAGVRWRRRGRGGRP